MKIDKGTWHYRLYRWWLERKFTGECGMSTVYVYPDGKPKRYQLKEAPDNAIHERLRISQNLCLYMRAVLIYAPFWKTIANTYCHLALAYVGISGIIYSELKYSGFNTFIYEVVTGLAIVAVVALLAFLGWLLLRKIVDKWRDKRNEPRPERKPSFYKAVVKPYIKARKSKICPFLTFE